MGEPLQSQRNLIFDRALDLLKEISVDRGDATSPAGVEEGLRDEEEVTQYPWLCLTEALRSTVELIEAQGGGAIGYQHGYGLSVYGYVKETEGRTRRQWLEDLWEDVKRKLLTNSRLVTPAGVELCQAILVSGDRETDGGASHPRGVFVQDFTIIYTEGMSG